MISTRLQRWLASSPSSVFAAWAMGAAFATYFCMYAFRKPFAVGTYEGTVDLPGIGPLDLKILFIISQVIGYASSKFLGIKVVSELEPHRRAGAILAFIALAELALLLFAVIPTPYNAFALVLNGLPLGMIWGLVFGFLEGRKTSDLLGAGLCASFIVASGFTKMTGKLLMDAGVPELWMPFFTGLVFFPPLLLVLWLLAHVPEPTEEDVQERTRREPMDAGARRAFFRAYAPGLTLLIAGYVLLTAYRDFRDNFARELWDALGYAGEPSILTTAELPIALGSLLAIALVVRVRDNRNALQVIHGILITGAALTLGSTVLYQMEIIGPAAWMIGVGLGLYLGYVPFNCVLFDRLVAAVGKAATAGFLIYVADASGYLGSVALLLYKSLGQPDLSWLDFFVGASYVTGVACALLFAASMQWFKRESARV
ncbi:MAG: DUF5690 family protein [Myxococcota bacterium]